MDICPFRNKSPEERKLERLPPWSISKDQSGPQHSPLTQDNCVHLREMVTEKYSKLIMKLPSYHTENYYLGTLELYGHYKECSESEDDRESDDESEGDDIVSFGNTSRRMTRFVDESNSEGEVQQAFEQSESDDDEKPVYYTNHQQHGFNSDDSGDSGD
ncbi:unnamed protein product [Fusarium graminearum]|uniref:Uncharacterized protein n=1 Tax=Gibberella zeae TaxID=5518 RepID=A0A679NWU5_GIBZA|nr:unnamed protein product [Fusarium graminearum]CAF3492865.1 unnamed protein product [Fusarium graminearum]CAG1976769.1 unnamed protein product [Fusarium graminearum]CAG1995335.1 unnamed protein product [Fusarium graminearum]CZS79969.1 unnamed protein product [Fusarium graminearum]